MKHTPTLLIVTADDFPICTNVSKACDELVSAAGEGRHLYGGKHYHGHHVVMRKWAVSKNYNANVALARLS